MTVWIVLACIGLILLLAGSIALKIDVSFGSTKNADVVLHILFFSIVLLPQSQKKKKDKCKKKSPKSQPESAAKTQSKEAHESKKQKNNLTDIIELAKQFLTPLPDLLGTLRKGLLFKNIQVHWRISDVDAAKTALQYAHACQAFYGLLGVAGSLFDVRLKQVRIYPDFWNEDPYYSVDFRVQIRVWRVVSGGIKYLFAVLKNLIKIKFTPGVSQNKKVKERVL